MSYNISRYVGVELEVAENTSAYIENPPEELCRNWYVKEDGSVGNCDYDYGIEYVFSQKLTGDVVVEEINRICDYFERRKNAGEMETSRVNNGFHLHLDYTDRSKEQVFNLCHISDILTDSFFEIVSSSRIGNSYCRRFSRGSFKGDFNATYENYTGKSAFAQALVNISRQCWISPFRYAEHLMYGPYGGSKETIEIRLHQGTSDREEILTWIEFWANFANHCDEGNITEEDAKLGMSAVIKKLSGCISDKTAERFLA